jgi:hypothetical protein
MRPSLVRVLEIELVYELIPGHIESWEVVELVRTKTGSCILKRGHNYRYNLEPTRFVLDGLERALKRITPPQIARARRASGLEACGCSSGGRPNLTLSRSRSPSCATGLRRSA